MTNGDSIRLSSTIAQALKRPQYVSDHFLTSSHLLTEQQYRHQRLQYHNRYLHDWGVRCGLQVVPARDPSRPWAVQACPGYAIDCCGDEIVVTKPAVVDVRDQLWRRPREEQTPTAYVGLRYAEKESRPVPTQPAGCGCDEPVYQFSRIEDSFRVDILWVLPETDETEQFDLCEDQIVPCPHCPDHVYVILARLSLPANEGDPITASHIENVTCQRLPYISEADSRR